MATNVAFEILYREYYVRIFGLCRRLLNSASLAEDATQEVFLRAYRNFGKYDTARPFWQWISAIASNHCIDLLRKRDKSERLFGDEHSEMEQLAAPGQAPLASLIEAQDRDTLNAAIEKLPDKYRVPLVLAYFHDSSYEQIAEDLAISRSHVGVLLLRAKQRLRASVADTGGEELEA